MSEPDRCRHCGYSQPTDAATCPGCGRRHRVVRRDAPRRLPALANELGLVGPARRARGLLVATGWLAAAFALAATARLAMSFEDVSGGLADTTLLRITELTRSIGWLLGVASILSGVAVAGWVWRSRSNLAALHLEPRLATAWSLVGWAVPGRTAERERRQVDLQWRDTSIAVAPLPARSHGRGRTRLVVSQVVVRWWAMWMALPGAVAVLAILLGHDVETSTIARERELVVLAAAALLVVGLRSTYDVIGIVTVAQAHRADALLAERDAARRTGSARPTPEPLVVVDHELEAAGFAPGALSDEDLTDHLTADDQDGATGADGADRPVTEAGAAADDASDHDVYDLSTYFVR